MADLNAVKPAGGIAAVAVVPAGAAAGLPPGETDTATVAVPLIEERSSYDEVLTSRNGVVRVEHRLTIAVPFDWVRRTLDETTFRSWAVQGVAAVVDTEAGERLAVGWPEPQGCRQPLRLAGIEASTDKTPHATPAAIITLRSVDTAPAVELTE